MIDSEDPEKIKVLHVTVGLEIGGVEILLEHLLPALNRKKVEVTVCSLKEIGTVGKHLLLKGIPVVALDGRNKFSFTVYFKLLRLLARENFDIIQSHLFLANMITGQVLFLRKILFPWRKTPVWVATYHGLGKWARWHHKIVEKVIFKLSNKIVCCSEAVKNEFFHRIQKPPSRYEVILNGISLKKTEVRGEMALSDGQECDPIFNRRRFVIGTIGRLKERVKGTRYLIQAVHFLKERIDLGLVIVGSGSDEHVLQKLTRDLQLTEQIMFIKEACSRDILRHFDLFVLPSLSEGFGLVLLEAMAEGRPIVATNVGGIPEVVIDGRTGMLVPPKNPEALADAISYMYDNRLESAEMGRAGKKRVEAFFDIGETAARTEKLYDQLIKENVV